MQKLVVGIVGNPYKDGELTTVVGCEFYDCPGFYQFYAINSNGHFRKRPDKFDDIHPISKDVYRALKGDWGS